MYRFLFTWILAVVYGVAVVPVYEMRQVEPTSLKAAIQLVQELSDSSDSPALFSEIFSETVTTIRLCAGFGQTTIIPELPDECIQKVLSIWTPHLLPAGYESSQPAGTGTLPFSQIPSFTSIDLPPPAPPPEIG